MKSLAEGLPPQVAKQIHPDWRKNEAEYWAAHDQLLAQYRGKWIGFDGGQVIVVGTSPVEVFHQAQAAAPHAFVACVGRENEPSRMRRATFPYDAGYAGRRNYLPNSYGAHRNTSRVQVFNTR